MFDFVLEDIYTTPCVEQSETPTSETSKKHRLYMIPDHIEIKSPPQKADFSWFVSAE